MTSERKGPPSPVSLNCQLEEVHMKRKLVKSSNEEEIINAPLSPRVRRRLDSAKENANIFGTVCEQGEVIQWMSAISSNLIGFGKELERKGYITLSSIVFLTEEDISVELDPTTRHLLLSTLSRLRHEYFRM